MGNAVIDRGPDFPASLAMAMAEAVILAQLVTSLVFGRQLVECPDQSLDAMRFKQSPKRSTLEIGLDLAQDGLVLRNCVRCGVRTGPAR